MRTHLVKTILTCVSMVIGLGFLGSLASGAALAESSNSPSFRQIREIETGFLYPVGLTFSPGTSLFFVLEASSSAQAVSHDTDVIMLTSLEQPAGSISIEIAVTDPINLAFDRVFNRLLLLQPATNELLEIAMRPDGTPDPTTLIRNDTTLFGVGNPQGMTVDPTSGQLFRLFAIIEAKR